jgi:hypothetical protein
MERIFTKEFFQLSPYDQACIVEAVLQDIERHYGLYISPEDEKRARQQAECIRAKAIKYGILRGQASPDSTAPQHEKEKTDG